MGVIQPFLKSRSELQRKFRGDCALDRPLIKECLAGMAQRAPDDFLILGKHIKGGRLMETDTPPLVTF